ncbi:WbqC family protein [Chloroflexota bacterium]
MKIVSMHQPNYLPWLGYFSKIAQSDCFVIADNLPYTKQTVTNRNKIRIKDSWVYLTIPIGSNYYNLPICNVVLPRNDSWMANHWKIIFDNYVKSDFFNLYKDFFQDLYQKKFKYLGKINTEIILCLLKCFKIDKEIIIASELDLDPELQKTDLLIALLKSADADIYLSGPSGRNYLDLEKFRHNGIEVKFFEFQHPVYKQKSPGFEPAMAAIDLLFNMGPQASGIIKSTGNIENLMLEDV